MSNVPNFNLDNIEDEDKIAMAEAYRTYEILDEFDQRKIPSDFVETILRYGDLESIKPFKTKEEFDSYDFSQKGKYLLMYMCTFNQ